MPELPQYLYDVFISYSHADRTWVWRSLLPRLEKAGVKVCIDDRDFEYGVPSLINMERAVDNSRRTLIVLTPDWVASAWTDFESLLVATKDPAARHGRLLPLKLIACEPPPRIAMLSYADFSARRKRTQSFDLLLKQLQPAYSPRKQRSRASAPTLGRSNRKPPALNAFESPVEDLPAFVVGLPVVHPRHFFGHEQVVKRLFNLLKRRPLQNAIVIGPRRSGKTSLLLYLKNLTTIAATAPEELRPEQRDGLLPQPDCYRWVFVDFQDPRLGSREGLLRYLLENLSLPVPKRCDLDGFMDVVSGNLRAPTVILLDEIDVALQRYPELDNTFWEGLRALATTQVEGNLSFILAASEPPYEMANHSGIGSPFFNIFGYTVAVGPLAEPDARRLIESSPIPFLKSDVEWILAESGGWAILLQILCRERLMALEIGEAGDGWRTEGLRQMEPFRHLLSSQ